MKHAVGIMNEHYPSDLIPAVQSRNTAYSTTHRCQQIWNAPRSSVRYRGQKSCCASSTVLKVPAPRNAMIAEPRLVTSSRSHLRCLSDYVRTNPVQRLVCHTVSSSYVQLTFKQRHSRIAGRPLRVDAPNRLLGKRRDNSSKFLDCPFARLAQKNM